MNWNPSSKCIYVSIGNIWRSHLVFQIVFHIIFQNLHGHLLFYRNSQRILIAIINLFCHHNSTVWKFEIHLVKMQEFPFRKDMLIHWIKDSFSKKEQNSKIAILHCVFIRCVTVYSVRYTIAFSIQKVGLFSFAGANCFCF